MSYFDTLYKPCLLDRHKIKVVSAPEFIILVDTALTGSASDTMQLPIRGTDMIIDWGDGDVETGVTQTALPSSANWITRVYPDGGGIKQIKITGLDWIYFNNTGDSRKLLEIQNWGTGQWATMQRAFMGCRNMTGTFTDVPDLGNVTDMSHMFNTAHNFNSDISNWDVSNVTNMRSMFQNAAQFNQDISNWDMGNVTNLSWMFLQANHFNGDISNWDVGKVTNMSYMFFRARDFNSDISSWNTAKVTDMRSMFYRATAFNQDLSGWCVSLIPSLPTDFDNGASAWAGGTTTRPQWGQPCP